MKQLAFLLLLALLLYGIVAFAVFGGLLCMAVLIAYLSVTLRRAADVAQAPEFIQPSDVTFLRDRLDRQSAIVDEKLRLLSIASRAHLQRRASNPHRFDQRKPKAAAINLRLDQLAAEFEQASFEISNIRVAVNRRVSEWVKANNHWQLRRSVRWALCMALLCHFLVSLVVYSTALEWLRGLTDLLSAIMWFSLPSLGGLYASLLIGFAASLPVALLGAYVKYRHVKLGPDSTPCLASEWYGNGHQHDALQEFERIGLDDNFSLDQSIDAAMNDEPVARPWYEILEVDSRATKKAVKAAYRKKIKQYHPDRVADLGPKLRDVAEAESRVLNAAYEEGMRTAR